MKSIKRLLENTANGDGSLQSNKFAAAILQYRNTPLPGMNLSPAQILLHRQLRDLIPNKPNHYKINKDWILSAMEREEIYSKRNIAIATQYDDKTRCLKPLERGQHVLLQCKEGSKWKDQGVVVEVLPFRQYRVRMLGSGRITLRNRRFLKPCQGLPFASVPLKEDQQPMHTGGQQPPVPDQIVADAPLPQRLMVEQSPTRMNQHQIPNSPPQLPTLPNTSTETVSTPPKQSRMLTRLLDYNKKGLQE